MAEREGFEPSMFYLLSIAYEAIMSRSCLMVIVSYATPDCVNPTIGKSHGRVGFVLQDLSEISYKVIRPCPLMSRCSSL